ncbi:MAG: NCS2 family permease, partial [bacterium]|nr:NCS2 family permease [bacterium]
MSFLNRHFRIEENGSTLGREVVGGLTTFTTMSYIVFVQPTVLHACGMPFGSVLVATCLSSALACILMGLYANYPFALAPGMGENFFFAFTVCSTFAGGMGFSWQAGLAIVFISGVIFLVLSAFNVREKLLLVLPDCLKNAIGPAIGLFIAFIGLQWGGIIKLDPCTMVTLGGFRTGVALLTCFGVLLIAALMALRVPGGILIGILATCGIGVATGVMPKPEGDLDRSFETFFSLNFTELIENWHTALVAIVLFFFMDLFDTVGTLVGVGKQAGYIGDDGHLPRANRAFLSDAGATCFGALFGTSTVTSYIESATGVAAGARTGLASVVTGVCFLGAILLAPIVRVVG